MNTNCDPPPSLLFTEKCGYCISKFAPTDVIVSCSECPIMLCVRCHCFGAESGQHKRGHNYKLFNRHGGNVFKNIDKKLGPWGFKDEKELIDVGKNTKLSNWTEIANNMRHYDRSSDALQNHFDQFFIRGKLGQFAMNRVKWLEFRDCISRSQWKKFDMWGDRMKQQVCVDSWRCVPSQLDPLNPDNAFEMLKCYLDGKGIDSSNISIGSPSVNLRPNEPVARYTPFRILAGKLSTRKTFLEAGQSKKSGRRGRGRRRITRNVQSSSDETDIEEEAIRLKIKRRRAEPKTADSQKQLKKLSDEDEASPVRLYKVTVEEDSDGKVVSLSSTNIRKEAVDTPEKAASNMNSEVPVITIEDDSSVLQIVTLDDDNEKKSSSESEQDSSAAEVVIDGIPVVVDGRIVCTELVPLVPSVHVPKNPSEDIETSSEERAPAVVNLSAKSSSRFRTRLTGGYVISDDEETTHKIPLHCPTGYSDSSKVRPADSLKNVESESSPSTSTSTEEREDTVTVRSKGSEVNEQERNMEEMVEREKESDNEESEENEDSVRQPMQMSPEGYGPFSVGWKDEDMPSTSGVVFSKAVAEIKITVDSSDGGGSEDIHMVQEEERDKSENKLREPQFEVEKSMESYSESWGSHGEMDYLSSSSDSEKSAVGGHMKTTVKLLSGFQSLFPRHRPLRTPVGTPVSRTGTPVLTTPVSTPKSGGIRRGFSVDGSGASRRSLHEEKNELNGDYWKPMSGNLDVKTRRTRYTRPLRYASFTMGESGRNRKEEKREKSETKDSNLEMRSGTLAEKVDLSSSLFPVNHSPSDGSYSSQSSDYSSDTSVQRFIHDFPPENIHPSSESLLHEVGRVPWETITLMHGKQFHLPLLFDREIEKKVEEFNHSTPRIPIAEIVHEEDNEQVHGCILITSPRKNSLNISPNAVNQSDIPQQLSPSPLLLTIRKEKDRYVCKSPLFEPSKKAINSRPVTLESMCEGNEDMEGLADTIEDCLMCDTDCSMRDTDCDKELCLEEKIDRICRNYSSVVDLTEDNTIQLSVSERRLRNELKSLLNGIQFSEDVPLLTIISDPERYIRVRKRKIGKASPQMIDTLHISEDDNYADDESEEREKRGGKMEREGGTMEGEKKREEGKGTNEKKKKKATEGEEKVKRKKEKIGLKTTTTEGEGKKKRKKEKKKKNRGKAPVEEGDSDCLEQRITKKKKKSGKKLSITDEVPDKETKKTPNEVKKAVGGMKKRRKKKVVTKKDRRLQHILRKREKVDKESEEAYKEMSVVLGEDVNPTDVVVGGLPRFARLLFPEPGKDACKGKQDDMDLLAFYPGRTDYEMELYNDAEFLVSHTLTKELVESSEVLGMENEIKIVRSERYSRVMAERLAVNRAIEHHGKNKMFLEFLQQMNTMERRKASEILNGRPEEEILLAISQQCMLKAEIEQMAEKKRDIDCLMARVSKLQSLQRDGVEQLSNAQRNGLKEADVTKKNKKCKDTLTPKQKLRAKLQWKKMKKDLVG